MRAARSPSHGKGSKNPNMAREGMVCRILAAPMTGFAQRGERVSQMPAGTAMAVAKSIAAAVSQRCSRVSVAISLPYWARKPELMVVPRLLRRAGYDEMSEHRLQSPDDESEETPQHRGWRSACLH